MTTTLASKSMRLMPHRSLASIRAAQCQRRSYSVATVHVDSNPYFSVSEEIRDALHSQKPVVALETAIYTHGYPSPENIHLSSRLESIVRGNGGVPATIGVLNGVARVGLQPHEMVELASSAGKSTTKKVSRRDLSYVCSHGLNGGTTISGTMVLAHLAGIKVLATGGLGGVHRGAEKTMDVSADLTELSRTPVVVVSSGCKGFLDIPRTIEYLETQGVVVATLADGRQGKVDFPAFWARNSGIMSPLTLSNEKEAAQIVDAQFALPLGSGIHIANPIPQEHAIDRDQMETIIHQALDEAAHAGAEGKDITPFVLARIRLLSEGRSIAANTALVEANVACGARVAAELCNLQRPSASSHQSSNGQASQLRSSEPESNSIQPEEPVSLAENPKVVVAGSLAIDLSCDFMPSADQRGAATPLSGTSNPASIKHNLGGVGRNVATAAHRAGASTRLCSLVGRDLAGDKAIQMLIDDDLSAASISKVPEPGRTAQYVAVNDAKRNLVLAMADMELFNLSKENGAKSPFDPSSLLDFIEERPDWLVVDANWDARAISNWLQSGKAMKTKTAFEPVSVEKARRLFDREPTLREGMRAVHPDHLVDIATPNAQELAAMYAAARDSGLVGDKTWDKIVNLLSVSGSKLHDRFIALKNATLVNKRILQQSIELLHYIPCIITTLGEQGVLLTQIIPPGDDRTMKPGMSRHFISQDCDCRHLQGAIYVRLFPAVEKIPQDEIVSVNGVGDTFLGTLVATLAQCPGAHVEDVIDIAQAASVRSLKSDQAVSPEIKPLANARKAQLSRS